MLEGSAWFVPFPLSAFCPRLVPAHGNHSSKIHLGALVLAVLLNLL